jgi:hypothetical protein
VSRRKKDSLVLHYSPGKETRLGLAPLVMGIVKGVAMEILKLERISVQQTKTRERDGADVFQVNWSPPVQAPRHSYLPSSCKRGARAH